MGARRLGGLRASVWHGGLPTLPTGAHLLESERHSRYQPSLWSTLRHSDLGLTLQEFRVRGVADFGLGWGKAVYLADQPRRSSHRSLGCL